MLPIIIVFLCAIGLFTIAAWGMYNKEEPGAIQVAVVCVILGAFMVTFGTQRAYRLGFGELRDMSTERCLEENATYQVVVSGPIEPKSATTKYAVILQRERDGHLSACLMNSNPPKVFRFTGDKDNPFQLLK